MTDKELHKLKRAELLEMLIAQSKELEAVRGQLKDAEKKLEDRKIHLEKAGNIAEAAILVNGVFEAANKASAQYLENIEELSKRQEKICAEMEQRTKKKCADWEKETQAKCAELERDTQIAVDKQWEEISGRLEAFYNAHKGLRELLESSEILK